jgi:hypothetical protein
MRPKMLTVIDVVDSAVKIGLGALISGLTTYWATRSKTRQDIAKAALEERRALLRQIALDFESATARTNDFFFAYGEINDADDADAAARISRPTLQPLIDSHKIAGGAHAMASLIGLPEVSDAIKRWDELAIDLVRHFSGDNKLDQEADAYVEKTADQMNATQNDVANYLAGAYTRFCAAVPDA